jgi:hypothetical protein
MLLIEPQKRMNKQHILFLFIGIFFISLLSNHFKTMSYPPDANHMWRQCDAYSMTLNYYNDKLPLLKPQMHFQASTNGQAVGEFPIIYYLQAKLWELTGPQFWVSRVFIYCLSVLGIVALFLMVFDYTRNLFSAYISSLLVFISPLFLFYANSFLVNIPAISFLFISWYFLLKFFQNKYWVYLASALFFVSISGLLRPTMLIGYMPFILVLLVNSKKILLPNSKKIIYASLLLIPFLTTVLWVIYAESYNAAAESNYFLTTIRPIWDCDNISAIWSRLVSWNLNEVHHISILIIGLVLLLFFFVEAKRQKRELFLFILTLFISLILYILFWFNNLDVHEYYLIELLLMIPALTIATTVYFQDKLRDKFPKISFQLVASFFVLLSILYGASKTRIKHDKKVFFLTEFFLSAEEIDYYQWYHWNYETKYKAFETIAPYLRKIGISKNELVISLPDPSPNCSLSMMDQKGFTYLYSGPDNIVESIANFKQKGAKYLLMADLTEFKNIDFGNNLNKKIGQFQNISIYKLTNE